MAISRLNMTLLQARQKIMCATLDAMELWREKAEKEGFPEFDDSGARLEFINQYVRDHVDEKTRKAAV